MVSPVTITVRSTRHGPVISDTYGPLKDQPEPKATATPFKDRAGIELPEPYVIALRWTALEPDYFFEAVWGFDRAAISMISARPPAISSALRKTWCMLMWMGTLATRCQAIYRSATTAMGVARPRLERRHEWKGYIPFDELPYIYNPPEDFISTANNQVPPNDYPYLVTTDWDYGFRAERIVQLIQMRPAKLMQRTSRSMQGDDLELDAATLVPILLGLASRARSRSTSSCSGIGITRTHGFAASRPVRGLLVQSAQAHLR